ncbi:MULTISPECIES: hypothetical protein [unclassified Bradyrhizobium]|uniref:Transposase n=1 Tax=Bradyrhizobium sp. LLZ17 TaxID=3239388 RepID=A0AB39XDJ4_9BRAD
MKDHKPISLVVPSEASPQPSIAGSFISFGPRMHRLFDFTEADAYILTATRVDVASM